MACGITHILAPVLDISRDSRMGRQGESYGEDPALASAMGVAYTKGIQETSVDGRQAESVAKHFWHFITRKVESMEPIVIHRKTFYRKYMENLFRRRSRKPD